MIKVLKAGAGTGKTYRLSLEYVAALLRGIDFRRIAVMTFTRRATAEIRDSIFQHLENLIEEGEGGEVFSSLKEIYEQPDLSHSFLKDIQHEMLISKDQIKINTIDSFINRIFKETIAPYLGVYDYQVIEDGENRELIEEVFRRLLDNHDDYLLLEKFLSQHIERDVKDYLGLIQGVINSRWKFLLIDYQQRKKREVNSPALLLDKCLDYLFSIAREKGKEPGPDFFIKDFRSLWRDYYSISTREDKEAWILRDFSSFFSKSFWNGNKIRGKKVAPLKEELEACYQEFLEQLSAVLYNRLLLPYEEEIFNFSQRIFQLYDQIKFRERAFTHQDLSNYTYSYLNHSELDLLQGQEVSSYFTDLMGTEVKALLIDEFQDTSILQWKILRPLINSSQRVITVGDEKQSIYGWRGGEKELFSRLDQILEGETEQLNCCYRSQQEIVGFVNRFFQDLREDWEYRPVKSLPGQDGGYVSLLLGGKGLKVNTETKSFLSLSKEKQEQIRSLNEEICEDLPAEMADVIGQLQDHSSVGVLARTNGQLVTIADRLDERGIPYYLESKDSLLDHQALRPLYHLLCYLARDDYFSLLKFLRSQLVQIDNLCLRYLLEEREQIQSFLDGERKKIHEQKLEPILSQVRDFRDYDYLRLTEAIFSTTGVLDYYRDNSGALKNIYAFYEVMRKQQSLSQLMEFLAEKRDGDQLKQKGIEEAGVVQLMTVHQAKGLTFDTQFLYWKPGGPRGRQQEQLEFYLNFDQSFERVEDFLLTSTRYKKLFEHLGFDYALEAEKRALMEEINNLYVAMTRPRNNLFLFIEGPKSMKPDSKGKYWSGKDKYGFYEEALLVAAEIDSLAELVTGKELGSPVDKEQDEAGEAKELPPLNHYFHQEYISTAVPRDAGLNLKLEYRRLEGLAAHYYLEHIRYNRPQEREYAQRMVLSRYGNILGPERMEKLFNRLDGFIEKHPLLFSEKWEVFTEYGIFEGENFYRLDRLLVDREKKEIFIIDYKTGEEGKADQLDKYCQLIAARTNNEYQLRAKYVEI